MRSFFVKDNDVNKECACDIEYSRSYRKGKSFWCEEYNPDKSYFNNDFIQHFVIYNNALYVCLCTDKEGVRSIPPTNPDYWALVVRSADIVDVSATVDSNVGKPWVEIVTEGEGLDKQIKLEFHNLKGERGFKGDQGEQGIQGEKVKRVIKD